MFTFLDIAWPVGEEALSEEARMAVDKLLTVEVDKRPAAKGTHVHVHFWLVHF